MIFDKSIVHSFESISASNAQHFLPLGRLFISYNIIILARTPEMGQGLGRILSCGARKQEQT